MHEEMQQQHQLTQQQQQQQQLAGLPEDSMLAYDVLQAGQGQQQQQQQARLQDSPYMRERLAASTKQQDAAHPDPAQVNNDVVRKLYASAAGAATSSVAVATEDVVAAAAATAAAGGVGSQRMGGGDVQVLAEPVLGPRSAKKEQVSRATARSQHRSYSLEWKECYLQASYVLLCLKLLSSCPPKVFCIVC
jgi:hypothetical protein